MTRRFQLKQQNVFLFLCQHFRNIVKLHSKQKICFKNVLFLTICYFWMFSERFKTSSILKMLHERPTEIFQE